MIAMDQTKISAAGNLRHKSKKLVLIAVALVVVVALVNVLVLSFAFQQTKKYQVVASEKAALMASRETSGSVVDFIQKNQDVVDKLNEVFPNEDSIIDVISATEAVIQQYDPQGVVEISAFNPSKVNNELQVPLLIKMRVSVIDLVGFLRELEKQPYVYEVTSIDMRMPEGLTAKGEITIGVKLYVQDPFITTPKAL